MTQSQKRQVVEELSAGNMEKSGEFLAEDIKWIMIGYETLNGKKAVLEFAEGANLGSTFSNTSFLEKEDEFVVEGVCKSKEDPENITGMYCDIYRFSNDKLAEIVSYFVEIK